MLVFDDGLCRGALGSRLRRHTRAGAGAQVSGGSGRDCGFTLFRSASCIARRLRAARLTASAAYPTPAFHIRQNPVSRAGGSPGRMGQALMSERRPLMMPRHRIRDPRDDHRCAPMRASLARGCVDIPDQAGVITLARGKGAMPFYQCYHASTPPCGPRLLRFRRVPSGLRAGPRTTGGHPHCRGRVPPRARDGASCPVRCRCR